MGFFSCFSENKKVHLKYVKETQSLMSAAYINCPPKMQNAVQESLMQKAEKVMDIEGAQAWWLFDSVLSQVVGEH